MAMKKVIDIVRKLIENGVYLYVEGTELKYRSKKGVISQEQKKQVQQNKTAIINYLLKVQQQDIQQGLNLPDIKPGKRETNIPLSYAQQRLWFVDQLGEGSVQYNTQGYFLLKGKLNITAVQQALKGLLDRHEVLRTRFTTIADEPQQVIVEDFDLPLVQLDLSQLKEDERTKKVRQLMQEEANKAFNLSKDLMLRVCLLTLSKTHGFVFYTIHHIIADGWSTGIIKKEFNLLYDAYRNNQDSPLVPLKIQYADYALWQRDWLQGGVLEKQLDYWKQHLSEIPLKHNFPFDNPRPDRQTYAGKLFQQQLSKELSEKIKEKCREHEVTLFMFLQTAFAVLLGRYSNETDIVMGAAVAGRIHHDVENLIGLFLNILVLRTDLSKPESSDGPTFSELLKKSKRVILDAYENQFIPFEMLVEELSPERHLSHNSVVQILFGVQNNERISSNKQTPESKRNEEISEEIPILDMSTRFDLKLDVYETGDVLSLAWLYNTSLFKYKSISRLAKNYEVLLNSVLENLSKEKKREKSIDLLGMLSEAEKQKLLIEWNTNEITFPKDKCVHEIFEEQVVKDPEAIAVVYEGRELSYAELNLRANRIAHYLIEQEVKPDSLVALCLERSLEMVVALLGILKSGAAYVPLDPAYPESRLDFMLSDCKASIILTQKNLRNLFTIQQQKIICLDEQQTTSELSNCNSDDVLASAIGLNCHHLAYVIYTSGSTGKPKGVLISHRNVCDFLHQAVEEFLPDHITGAVVSSPLVFDATVGSLLVPLCAGKYAELLPEGVFSLDRLSDCLADDEEAFLFKITPSHLEAVVTKGYMQKNAHAEHVLVVAGEPLQPSNLNYWIDQLLPNSQFINEYGPTEATVGCTTYPIPNSFNIGELGATTVPIGSRFGDTELYVMDGQFSLRGIGCIGELYIGGAGLARGYLGRASLTAERFVPHRYSQKPGMRLYRTGDLVRYLRGGKLEFIGRIDHQVKVRGYRIELGEIESQLLSLKAIRETVVVAVDEADVGKRLVTYLVIEDSSKITKGSESKLTEQIKTDLITQFKAHLVNVLPQYMVPEVYVFLDKFQLTSNGKIDRHALPVPGERDLQKQVYTAPRDEIEKTLCQLWQDILKVERIGITDNFFTLGGHSLLATRVVSSIRQEFEVELPLRVLFESPTIAGLSDSLRENLKAPSDKFILPPVLPADRDQALPLSYAQQRLWFIDRLGEGSVQYNMPGYFMLQGKFSTDAFGKALKGILDRHEVLRTFFTTIADEPQQVIVQDYELPLSRHDLSGLNDIDKAERVQRLIQQEAMTPFNLSEDLMLRVCQVKLSDNEHLIIYTMHHIASDGWSMGIFKKELAKLYDAFTNNRANPLAPLKVQYADYAQWQRQWLQGKILKQQLDYWCQKLADIPPLHRLPLDKPRPPQQAFGAQTHNYLINKATTDKLNDLSQAHDVTLFMLLQSAFSVLLGHYGNQHDIVMGVPIAGRTHSDIEPLVGLFINSLVLRTHVTGEMKFVDLLKANKSMILDAYAHQDIPFEKLVEVLQPERHMAYPPLFQIWFSLQNNERVNMSFNDAKVSALNITKKPGDYVEHYAKYELNLYITETDQGLLCTWRFNESLFYLTTMQYVAEQFSTLLDQILEQPKLAVTEYDIFSARRLQQNVVKQHSFPQPLAWSTADNIISQFKQQVQRCPGQPAVYDTEKCYSYQELDATSNQYATAIKQHCQEERVALLFGHKANMVMAILGALKAGKTYVPLDRKYPLQRLRYMLSDADVSLIISEPSDSELAQKLVEQQAGVAWLNIDEEFLSGALDVDSTNDFTTWSNPKQVAYILYTSGSTGQPKGVYQSQCNVLYFAKRYCESIQITAKDKILQLASFNFDAAVMDLFGALLSGASLHLVDVKSLTADEIVRYIEDQQISVYHSTPTLLKYLDDADNKTKLSTVRAVVLGGEAVDPSVTAAYLNRFTPDSYLVNGYGPTESTLALQDHCQYEMLKQGKAPILGHPIADTNVQIMKSDGQEAKVFEAGEIVIESPYVALGYWRQKELSKAKFKQLKGKVRRYYTGDHGRLQADGRIDYLGRKDSQIKLRGLRIELGEIELQLLQLNEVKAATVLLHQNTADQNTAGQNTVDQNTVDQKYLVAYVVLDKNVEKSCDDPASLLKVDLQKSLPEYMVPEGYVLLDEMPLTPSGKMDKKALPDLGENVLQEQIEAYVAPGNQTQERLCQLWKELLKVERVGIFDNFFALGGHSLLAMRLVSSIRQEFKLEMPLRELFETPTVAALSVSLDAKCKSPDEAFVLPPVLPANRDQVLPLSFAQQRLWFIDQLGEGSVQFNLPGHFLLQGNFNESAFKLALKNLLQRHEVLRTQFSTIAGEAQQVIVQDFDLPLFQHDFSQLSDQDKSQQVRQIAQVEVGTPFDLTKDLMLRVHLFKLSDSTFLILYTMHHIASDGWSRGVFQKELSALYDAFCNNQSNPLAPLSIQYADYALWQRQWLQGEVLDGALDYWKRQLADLPQVHSLPLDKPRPAKQRFMGKSFHIFIDNPLAAQITKLNQQHNTTLFMFMHTALSVLLSRYSGETDIVVGSSIAGRAHKDVESLIGFFVNDLVLRINIAASYPESVDFVTLLKQHQQTILDAYAHQYIPFEMLVEELNPQRSMSYSPLFQIKLDVQNNEQAKLSLSDLALVDIQANTQQHNVKSEFEHSIKHDLYISVTEQDEGLSLAWRYSTDLFFESTIERLTEHFVVLLNSIVNSPQQSVHSLQLLTPKQQKQLLLDGFGEETAYAHGHLHGHLHGQSIHELFAVQVEQSPDEIAVIHRDETLTYQQLNQAANQLAHYLIAQGVKPDTLVALCTERSLEMMVGLLGVLKAGGAYVPLDPASPQERLDIMLDDCDCRWVLTQDWLSSRLSFGDRRILPIDAELRDSLLSKFDQSNPQPQLIGLNPTHLAYVIYTSGSTGQPKGVMVEHDGMIKYCDYALEHYYSADLTGSLIATSYSFDLTVPSLYLPLLVGGHVRLLDEGKELEDLANALGSEQKPYLLRITPSHIQGMLPLLSNQKSRCPHVLIIGGEPLAVSTLEALREILPEAKLYNHYGPTESIVGCSLYPLTTERDLSGYRYCPIGRAMAHTQLVVLNKQLQLSPIGVVGELYIGGTGLARGYLNQRALTEQKFIPNPLSGEFNGSTGAGISIGADKSGTRLYRTGDLVRWLPDGNLEFIGRADDQVKIRGLRIELGEIEQGLLSLPGIRGGAVSLYEGAVLEGAVHEGTVHEGTVHEGTVHEGAGQNRRLVAYVVLDEHLSKELAVAGAEDEATLKQRKESLIHGYRESLSKHLPEYMVPQVYLFLERLPLTVNGKLDRQALPLPEESDLLKSRYVAPRNTVEEKLCELWQAVLKLKQVGIEDNFFQLGGHSLLATRLISAIREDFEIELPLRVLFEKTTISDLSQEIMADVFDKRSIENEKELQASDDIEEVILE